MDFPPFTGKYKVNSGRQGYYQRRVDTRSRESQVTIYVIYILTTPDSEFTQLQEKALSHKLHLHCDCIIILIKNDV